VFLTPTKLLAANSPGKVPKTASDLQREHVFIRVMLTFLRAIHAGAMHYKHSIPFLANYARLIEPFDICSKTIAEILRNEAILAEHSEEVCQVIIVALQDVSLLTPPSSLCSLTHTIGVQTRVRGRGEFERTVYRIGKTSRYVFRHSRRSAVHRRQDRSQGRRERPHHIAHLDLPVHRDVREKREQQTTKCRCWFLQSPTSAAL